MKNLICAWFAAMALTGEAADLQIAHYRANENRTGYFDVAPLKGPVEVKWKFKTGGPVVSSPVETDGMVVIGSLDGHIYALQSDTGQKIWDVDTGRRVSGSAAICGGMAYIASESGKLYAIETKTGKVRWIKSLDEQKRTSCSPLVKDGVVYIPQGGSGGFDTVVQSAGPIMGLDAETGQMVWQSAGGASQGMDAPIIYGSLLISSRNREQYAAFDLKTRKDIWVKARANSYGSQYCCSALENGMLFAAGTIAGSLHALDANTGEQRWLAFVDPNQKSIMGGGQTGNEILTSPAVAMNRVFVGSNNGGFYCFSATNGAALWKINCGKPVQSSPVIARDAVYFGCHDGTLRAVNANAGDELWRFNAGARIISSPWVNQDSVMFGCDDGYVYALK